MNIVAIMAHGHDVPFFCAGTLRKYQQAGHKVFVALTTGDSVPASVIENEKSILMSQIENDEKLKNKPDAVKEKMVVGRISKFYDNNCLVDQAYVKDEDMTVGKYTESVAKELGGEIKIVSFVKYERGEGIEKKEDNFAEEINKLVNGLCDFHKKDGLPRLSFLLIDIVRIIM